MVSRSTTAIAAALLLALACAKGIDAPTAAAGADQSVNAGTLVKLDGSASHDPQGRALAFDWSFVARPLGSAATITDSTTATPSFLADLGGVYKVQLVVSNSVLVSQPAVVTVTASACGRNPPVVQSIAASDPHPSVGSVVQFTAAVTDADNTAACGSLNKTFAYAWKITALPAGSAAQLNGPVSANPSIAADVAGDYTVQLVVTDNVGVASTAATTTIHVGPCGQQALTWPAAGAVTVRAQDPEAPGSDTQVHAGTRLAFVAHATEPNSCGAIAVAVAYHWALSSAPEASRAVLAPQPDGSAALVPDVQGAYAVSVTATDSLGNSAPVQVVPFATSECGRKPVTVAVLPAATSFSAPATLSPHESVALAVAGGAATSGDNQNDPAQPGYCPARFAVTFAYAWSVAAGPAGGDAALGAVSGPASAFTAGTPGDYSVLLRATASNGASAAATVFLQVNGCGHVPLSWPATSAVSIAAVDPDPTDPAADPVVHPGALVKLSPAVIDSNSCGSAVPVAVSYRWSLFATPPGSKAALANAAATVAAFVPDVAGTYQLSVGAEDSLGNASPLQFVTVATSSCGQNPVSVQATPPGTTLSAPFAANAQQLVSLGLAGGAATSGDNQSDFSKPGYCPSRFATSFSYRWQIVNQPAAGAGSLTNLAGATSGFAAGTPGSYSVEVVATASNGRVSNPSDVFLKVGSCGASAPVLQSVTASTSRAQLGQAVTLTAQGASPDAQNGCATVPTLTYAWTLTAIPAGSTVSTAGQTGAAAFTFTPDVAGTFAFGLVARDSNGHLSAPLAVTVPAGNCGPSVPSSNLISSGSGAVAGQPLTLTAPAGIGATQTCTAGSTYTYGWAVTSRPPQSTSALSASAGPSVTFVPDVPGIYIFQLTVTDAAGFSTQVSQPATVFGALAFGTAALPDGYVGTPYAAQVQVSGGKAPLGVATAPGSALPSGISLSPAGALAGTPAAAGPASFSLQVTDAAGATLTQPFTLYVWPVLSITTNSLANGYASAAYSQQLAATGGKPPYVFSAGALPAGLTLSGGGLLAGTPTAPGSGAVSLQVKDQNGAVATASISLTIAPALAVDTSVRPPDGYLLNAYAFNLPALGGLAPYTFTLVSGSTLPGGLTLSANKLSGTPTTTGNFNFTVQVTDSAFGTATGIFSMSVFGAPTITTAALTDAYVGSAYSLTLAASGGHPPLTFSIATGNTLPAGLQFSTAGAFSGTPTQTGNFPLTIAVTDASGTHGQSQFLLHAFAALAIGNAGFPDAYPGISYGPIALQANGGRAPYTWFLQSGALPSSIVLDAIAQTVTSNSNQVQNQSLGSYNFTLGLRDSNNVTVTSQQSISLYPRPAITHTQFVDAYVGDSYSDQLTATGGKAPLSWTLNSGGTPPAWLSISGSGAASGTVATPGSYSPSITVKDQNNIAATLTVPMQVYAPLAVTTPTALPVATEGSSYAQQLTSSGGKPAIIWSLLKGALPSGLTLSSTGAISGTPAGPGPYTITVQATDSNSRAATAQLTLSVAPGPFDISQGSGNVGDPWVTLDNSVSPPIVYVAYGNQTPFGGTRIEVARSADGGATFSTPVDAGLAAGGSPFGGVGAVMGIRSTDGALVILDATGGENSFGVGAYANSGYTARVSTDQGQTFSSSNVNLPGSDTWLSWGQNLTWSPKFNRIHYITGTVLSTPTTKAFNYYQAGSSLSGFGPGVQLVAAGGFGRDFPTVAETPDGVIIAAWLEASDAVHANVVVRRSTDGGATFGPLISLTANGAGTPPSQLFIRAAGPAAGPTSVGIYWQSSGTSYAALSTNSGASFAAPVLAASDFYKNVSDRSWARATSASTMVNFSQENSNGSQIACAVSRDFGLTFAAPTFLTTASDYKIFGVPPAYSTAFDASGAAYVAWAESASNGYLIYFRKYPTQCQ